MDNQVYSQIVRFIKGIADDCLRDVYVRGKYRDVILPMTVIRRLDALLEDTKEDVISMKKKLDEAGIDNQWGALCNVAGQAFCNASPFRMRDLTSRSKKQTLKADFEAYLDGFSPNVQEILEKFKFRNQIDTMIDADVLGSIIQKFISPDVNFSPNPVYKDDEKTIVRLPGLDNHNMGTIFEELIREFNEENNEEAGEHWTPRDVVELMADLIFVPIADKIKDATYACYDGACGTGGMLTVAQDRLMKLAEKSNKKVSIHLFGQEVNPETYAICKADMLLKGDGDQAEHISYGSTLSLDGNPSRQFDFMLSNPPYGKSWKTDAEKMEISDTEGKSKKKQILDSRFNAYLESGEVLTMLPRTSDGQLLFLLNNISKMKTETTLGSRIAEVHNGSSIFTGDAGSGESNARRYIIENDLVEAIIALPENMFYNTGIGTYIWILSNRKEARRKGKIQLIDATKMKSPLRKNMGKKNCEFTPEISAEILRIFMEMEESEVSMIFDNDEFAYWSITVERPLRWRVNVNPQTIGETWRMFQTFGFQEHKDSTPEVRLTEIFDFVKKYPQVREIKMPKAPGKKVADDSIYNFLMALIDMQRDEPYMDYNAFVEELRNNPRMKSTFKNFEDYLCYLIEVAPEAEIVRTKKGLPIPNVDLRDTEIVPFKYEGGIDGFIRNEVLTYAPDAWVDEKKTIIGYEISFTKYFYKPVELREMSDILANLNALEHQADGMISDIMEGIKQ